MSSVTVPSPPHPSDPRATRSISPAGQTEGLAEVSDRTTRLIGGERRDECRPVGSVVLGDASDQLGADVAGKVDVDVGQPDDVFVQEPADR